MSGIVGKNLGRGSGLVKVGSVGADTVTGASIADDAIDSEHYVNASIDNAHLADNAADTAEIADNAITLAKMAGGTDGNLITYDASGDPAYVASGTSGQFLKSQGANTVPVFADAAGGGGKVNQVVQNVITSAATSTSDTAFIATSHLVAITPSATDSNIYLDFSFNQGTNTNNRFPLFKIYRDIGGGGYSHLTDGVDGQPHEQAGTYQNAGGAVTTQCSLNFYDDPATTSACTYKVYIAMQDTTGTVNIYAGAGMYGYATAMEILA